MLIGAEVVKLLFALVDALMSVANRVRANFLGTGGAPLSYKEKATLRELRLVNKSAGALKSKSVIRVSNYTRSATARS